MKHTRVLKNNGTILLKKVFIFIIILLFLAKSFAQQPATSVDRRMQMDWIRQSDKQKRTCWTLVTIGSVLVATGLLVRSGEANEPNPSSTGSVLFFSGLGCIAISIPLFFAAGESRRKAMAADVSFKIEKMSNFRPSSFYVRSYPVVGVLIRI